MIPTAEVAEAHEALYAVLDGLTDEQVRAPSLLPDWTRGHVLAHVTDAGRALADLVEQALQGNQVLLYTSVEERDAIIEDIAGRTAAEHVEALREHSERLEAAWARVTGWDQPVRYRDGKLSSTVFARWREVWIHRVVCLGSAEAARSLLSRRLLPVSHGPRGPHETGRKHRRDLACGGVSR